MQRAGCFRWAEKHPIQYRRSIQSPGLGSICGELALNVKKSKHDVVDGIGNCNKAAQARELIDFIESQVVGPWAWEDSKEADRALVAGRYE